ncbi:Thioredoxin domain-containing protein 17 [Taenia solium]|eukprot:TsM_000819900 transcript=TsM_000819900 gene=TsM_000819900
MPAKQIYLRSHKELEEKLKELFASNSEQKVILLLEGSTDMTGESWEVACQEAEQLLEPILNSASEKTVFLMVEVGDEEAWQDENNFFKRHEIYKLTDIPALLLFTGPESVAKRLDGSACLDKNALTEFFK